MIESTLKALIKLPFVQIVSILEIEEFTRACQTCAAKIRKNEGKGNLENAERRTGIHSEIYSLCMRVFHESLNIFYEKLFSFV